jgi:hypothetical protein
MVTRHWPVWASRFGAVGVDGQRMVGNLETLGKSNIVLPLFNLGVVKLFHIAAI